MIWVAVITGSLGCLLLKVAGVAVPAEVLDRPVVRRIAGLLPLALLAALVAVQTFTANGHLLIDARAAGLGAAVVALLLRAPFLVVVATGAVVAAVVRALGWLP